jgi:hypothetical protein
MSVLQKQIKFEALTICVGYSDFLRWTMPFIKSFFDRFVVVTSPDDKETQELCDFWYVETVVTDAFYTNGDTFNKANGINAGLARLSLKDWVVHIDSDIFLPPRTGAILRSLPLDPRKLYSIDRINCKSFEKFLAYLHRPELQHPNTGFMGFNAFENGARLLDLGVDGWLPIGFFQLWNPMESGVFTYPNEYGAADRTDVQFTRRWTRANRELIPEIVGVHLESEECTMGANWQGRTTKYFGVGKC